MACEVNSKEINSQCAELLVRPTCIYICIYIYNFCVEVFEKTISRTEMIDHSFER